MPTSNKESGATALDPSAVTGCVVVVAKCPIPGKSKTRLVPLLGNDGSSQLAKAMLSDVLMTLEHCPPLKQVQKVLLYAPGDEHGLAGMRAILQEIGLLTDMDDDDQASSWKLLPMVSPDLRSSDLGDILQHALERIERADWHPDTTKGGVVFLGMDSPVLALADIVTGLSLARQDGSAMMCPADDGGYGMLCVPESACNLSIFEGVYWSHALTAISQMKALTDKSIPVIVGQLMHDIDEPHDVHRLCERLTSKKLKDMTRRTMGLAKNSQLSSDWQDLILSHHPECHYSRQALAALGLLEQEDYGEISGKSR